MNEQLKFIASYDDTIKFCENDVKLATRFRDIFEEAKTREITFDPIMSAASNPELFKKDIFSKKQRVSKRGLGRFDEEKYTKLFITQMKKSLSDPEKSDVLKRTGFDAYAYLMAYEEEIEALYKSNESLTKLQKAALHFVEVGKEEVELDYLKYVATYDDLTTGSVTSKPNDKEWSEWIEEAGKAHYENGGKEEILTGKREVKPFFDAVTYVATHVTTADAFKTEEGVVDEKLATVAYITFGSQNGLASAGFQPYMYLANYPELLEEDIYVNKDISFIKVAKLWLDKFADGIKLDVFDPNEFKEALSLPESADPYKEYVMEKLKEYREMLKKQASCFYKLKKGLKLPKLPKLPKLRASCCKKPPKVEEEIKINVEN